MSKNLSNRAQVSVIELVALLLGVGLTLFIQSLFRRTRAPSQQESQDQELRALREEIRSLRQDISQAVTAASRQARESSGFPESSYSVAARPPDPRDQELRALREEVRSLQQDIAILKVNPNIGEAVADALSRAPGSSGYAVAVEPSMSQHERELQALLGEVRALRQSINVLEANPEIGNAVTEALKRALEAGELPESSYAVLV